MNTEKPFDVLVIYEPMEYLHDSAKCKSLKSVGDFCREQNIPIRVDDGNRPVNRTDVPKEKTKDYLIRKYFDGCDYQPTLEIEELVDLGLNGHVRILLSGGLFDYVTDGMVETILELEPDLNRDEIANLDKNDNNRRIVIPTGCVTSIGHIIYQDISRRGQSAEIYIDGLSAVGYFDPIDHSDSLFKITKVTWNPSYTITRRIDRQDIIPSNN